jgi:AraC-like DNA-binding protein
VAGVVLSVASRAVLEACRRLGVDADAVMARAGIARAEIDDPDARLSGVQADAVWREAFAVAGDPQLALHAAEALQFGAYRVLDYLGTTGPTLGEGLRRVAEYFPLVDPRGVLRVQERAEGSALVFATRAGTPLPRPAQEYTLTVLFLRARHASEAAWHPATVEFAFPRPPDASEHTRIFGVPPRFDARDAALVLPGEVWNRPTRARDPGLFAVLDDHARTMLSRAPSAEDDLVARVRAAIATELTGRAPSLPSVARRLGTSARSLQRRLENERTSFAQVVDHVRRERAEVALQAPDVAIGEVSWLLGFSDQSAFARAFRRWTGQSPARWRRARAAGRD